jgi:putative membrane protein
MIEKFLQSRDDADVMKGIVAGVAGGLLASLVMEQFQFVWNKTAEAIRRASQEEKPKGRKQEPANVKAAQSISKTIFGKRLPKSRKKLAGEAVHYAMGTASAAIYGALAEASPATTLGDGLAFGSAVWLLADEVSVRRSVYRRGRQRFHSQRISTRLSPISSMDGRQKWCGALCARHCE